MIVFVARQLRLQRDGRALLDLRPLAHRPFVVSVVLLVLGMMSLFGVLILLPLYLQDVLRRRPVRHRAGGAAGRSGDGPARAGRSAGCTTGSAPAG